MTPDQTLLLWGFGLLAAALLLVVVELFLPSGGIIGTVAAVIAIAGVIALWRYDTVWGVIGTAAVLVTTPISFWIALRVWPNTPIGRTMFHGDMDPDELEHRAQRERAELDRFAALVGQEGEAMTDMHPIGVVIVEGVRYDALAEAGVIDAGQRVRISSVRGTQVKVMPIV